MAKRGRPRKTGPREPNGRPSRQPDKGVKKLQRLRAWFAQGGNPDLTEYPLGILLANDQITESQHRHACRYAWLHAMVFGRPSIAAMAWERLDRSHQPSNWDDSWLVQVAAQLAEAGRAFEGEPTLLRSVLDGLVIHERAPRFMRPVYPRASDIREAELLHRGMLLLDRHFSRERTRRRAA